MNRAVFLDRDGVLNGLIYRPEEGVYDSPYCLEEFCLSPRVAEAIALIHHLGMLAIVVSNQPGVAKGKCDGLTLDVLTRHLCRELERQEARLDGIYYCVHHPEALVPHLRVACDCRKPRPGLLLQAAREHSIDLCRSYMVGDSPKDIEAGLAAGCRTILIHSHNSAPLPLGLTPHLVATDLLNAIKGIQLGEV